MGLTINNILNILIFHHFNLTFDQPVKIDEIFFPKEKKYCASRASWDINNNIQSLIYSLKITYIYIYPYVQCNDVLILVKFRIALRHFFLCIYKITGFFSVGQQIIRMRYMYFKKIYIFIALYTKEDKIHGYLFSRMHIYLFTNL